MRMEYKQLFSVVIIARQYGIISDPEELPDFHAKDLIIQIVMIFTIKKIQDIDVL